MDIASACLVGKKCRYDGEYREDPDIKKLFIKGRVKPVCPECLAGLKVPRCPSEIIGGDGKDVLAGKAKVMGQDGSDRTNEFMEGAKKTLIIAKSCGASRAYMKAKSPSCGLMRIYDGTFSGIIKEGCGVTSAFLLENGIEVVEV
jgi:uncharacterized protein YbbK (DUF523 family)